MGKRGRIKLERERKLAGKPVMRFVKIDREAYDDEKRTVRVTIATENPVARRDSSRGVIREVLAMDGLQLRADQLPIVDSHDRSTVANVLGSVRNLQVVEDELQGVASFAADQKSQDAWRKLMDGHLTDFSITATADTVQELQRGETYTTSRGEVIEGPADIMLAWTPTDASLVAAGADERSTVHRSYDVTSTEVERSMNEELLGPLREMGLPEGVMEPNEILAWVVGNLTAMKPEIQTPSEAPAAEVASAEGEEEEVMSEEGASDTEERQDGEDEQAATEEDIEMAVNRTAASSSNDVQRALESERKRTKEIYALVEQAGLERSIGDKLAADGSSVDVARAVVLERLVAGQKPLGDTVRVTDSEADKVHRATQVGLTRQAFRAAGIKRAYDEDAPGAEDFERQPLSRLAENFVRRAGGKVERMAPKDIALVALGHQPSLDRFNIRRDIYHTTGSFPNLLLDAANKTLLAAYEEAPFTWNVWARQASSVPDFKAINRIRFSEVPSPEAVAETELYPESKMSDLRESYKVEKYGSVFTVSWETVVNDDLDALSRIPAMQGTACRRKQNQTVYNVLFANAAMADGGALFNTTAQTTAGGHANLASSGAAPSVTTLNSAFTSMMTKTGVNSKVILNIQPSFILCPVAISATVMQLLASVADPTSTTATNEDAARPGFNANVANIYGPNGGRPLRLVVDAVMDGNSSTAWYLAAMPSQIDTIELAFLQGEESPVLENEWDFDRDGWKYKVRQTFGVAPIDFRGLYKNPGA